MACPVTPEFWQRYQDVGDPEVTEHLASCATCRAEAAKFVHLQETLAQLPLVDVPTNVTARFHAMAANLDDRHFTCAEVLDNLDAWREGEVDATHAFLIEDHLLWCPTCALEAERADALQEALHLLPSFEVPSIIAERIAQAQQPWWRQLLPAPQPSLKLRFNLALAASVLMICGLSLFTQRAAYTPFATHPAAPRPIVALAGPEPPVISVQILDNTVAPVTTGKQVAEKAHRIRHYRQEHGTSLANNQLIATNVKPNDRVESGNIGNTVAFSVNAGNAPASTKNTMVTKPTEEQPLMAAAPEPTVNYSAERAMVARAISDRMTEIDDMNAAASEMIRSDVTRPRFTAMTGGY